MASSKAPVTFRRKRPSVLNSITEEDKQLAREMWVHVEKNYVVISRALFAELFAQHPEYKKFFKDLFKDDGTADAWLIPEFEKHMIQVLMPSIGMIMKNLDKPEDLEKHMINLGKIHRRKNMGLKRENVDTLKGILFETLKNFLAPKIQLEHEVALLKIFTHALNIFCDSLEDKL